MNKEQVIITEQGIDKLGKAQNLVGEVFNNYTVLSYCGIDNKPRPRHWWNVKCECGETKKMFSVGLKKHVERNRTQCIVCMAKTDLLNTRISNFKVIEYMGTDENKKHLWKIECDCGEVSTQTAKYLSKHKSRNSTKCRKCPKEIGKIKIGKPNEKYNNYTVLFPTTERYKSDSSFLWVVECECGSISKKPITYLKQHVTHGGRSCKECVKGKPKINGHDIVNKDLVGLQFSNYKVLSYRGINDASMRTWCVQCKCGADPIILTTTVLTRAAKNPNHKCAHCYKVDNIGKKYNNFTIVKFLHSYNDESHWQVRCDCGRYTDRSISSLSQHVRVFDAKKCEHCTAENLVGHVFANFTVLKQYRENGILVYKVKCNCGKIHKKRRNCLNTSVRNNQKYCSNCLDYDTSKYRKKEKLV